MKLRYSEIPFPPYAFRPGQNPHPRKDPKGHHYGKTEAISPRTSPEGWKKTPLYLYGVDLFNHHYYWEAHEAWESLWKALDPLSNHALFLQGLIQLSASHLKKALHEGEGERLLFAEAWKKLQRVKKSMGSSVMGIRIDDLQKDPTQIILVD